MEGLPNDNEWRIGFGRYVMCGFYTLEDHSDGVNCRKRHHIRFGDGCEMMSDNNFGMVETRTKGLYVFFLDAQAASLTFEEDQTFEKAGVRILAGTYPLEKSEHGSYMFLTDGTSNLTSESTLNALFGSGKLSDWLGIKGCLHLLFGKMSNGVCSDGRGLCEMQLVIGDNCTMLRPNSGVHVVDYRTNKEYFIWVGNQSVGGDFEIYTGEYKGTYSVQSLGKYRYIHVK